MHSALDNQTIAAFRPAPLAKKPDVPKFDWALTEKYRAIPADTVTLSEKSAAKNVVIQLPDGKIIHITPQQAQAIVAYVIGAWSMASQEMMRRQAGSEGALLKPSRFQEIQDENATETSQDKSKSTKHSAKHPKQDDQGLVRVNIANCDGKTKNSVEKKADHQGITINIINHNNQHNTQNAGQSGGLLDTVANATGLGGKYRLLKTVAGTALVAAVAIPLAIKLRSASSIFSSLGSIKDGVSSLLNRDNLVTGMVLTSAASRLRNPFSGSVKETVAQKANATLTDTATKLGEHSAPLLEEATQTFRNVTASATESVQPTALPNAGTLNFGQTVETLGNAYQFAAKGMELLPWLHTASNLMGMLMILPQVRRAMRMGNQRGANHASEAAAAASLAAKALEGNSGQKVGRLYGNVHGFKG